MITHVHMEPSRCPHCMRDVRLGVPMTAVKAALYDVVERAGSGGVTAAQVKSLVFNGRTSLANVRMHVSQINELLANAGVRIEGGVPLRGRFRLVRRGGRRGS